MRPNFDYYMARLDDWPFEVGVDLSVREAVPIDGLQFRLHVRLGLNNPSDDGLSTKEEDALLALIEDEMLHTLDSADYRFVAAVTHRKARTLVFYSRHSQMEGEAIHKVLTDAKTHNAKVISEEDPEWTEYTDVLYPNEEMLHQIMDRKVLKEFDRRGDDPASIHAIEPCFVNLCEEGVEICRSGLEAEGFVVTDVSETSRNGTGAKEFSLKARVKSPLGLAILDDFRHSWLSIAKKAKGSYRGWSSELVPISGDNNDHGLGGHLDDFPDPVTSGESDEDKS
ncbi:MAG: DUF695 domain-containing protein [Planctomycetota bacterium]